MNLIVKLALVCALVFFFCPSMALAQKGSLWEKSKQSGTLKLYEREEKKRPPIQKNDLILVMVMEQASATNDARLELQRSLETELLMNQFVRFSGSDLVQDAAPGPNIDFEASREVKGQGRTDRKENVQLRISAKVIDVRPNGNLIIEAKKEKQINDERTTVTLTGVIRTLDVSDDSSVRSDRIADMELAYSGKGPVSANTKWSWVGWIVDHIWPF